MSTRSFAMAAPKMSKLPSRWFFRGVLLGAMFVAALNGLSYFFRSDGWGSLLGERPRREAIGFPLEIWRLGGNYRGHSVDDIGMAINIGIGLFVGAICGSIAVTQIGWLNRMIDDFEKESRIRTYRPFQFSIGNILIATVPIAILMAAAKTGDSRVLATIYVLGPASLVLLAMLPRGLSWDWRVIILTPMAISLIIFSTGIAYHLGIDFEKVMLGVFVCWVPQSALAAIVLTAITLFRARREQTQSALSANQ